MRDLTYIRLMAQYNEWMNTKLYQAAATLPPQALSENRNAFFGSILGTLSHIAVGDTIWLKRFAAHPAGYADLAPLLALPTPASLDQLLFKDIAELHAYRKMLDQAIVKWAAAIKAADLDHVLHYANLKGVVFDRQFFSLIVHFFNHQTHHRGQASTLLFQAGVDIGVTDLMALIPNEPGQA